MEEEECLINNQSIITIIRLKRLMSKYYWYLSQLICRVVTVSAGINEDQSDNGCSQEDDGEIGLF